VTVAFAVGLYFFDTAFVFSRGTWMLNVLPTIQATLTFVAVNPNATIAMIGASGAIAAVMGAYLVWFPDAPVRTLLFVVLVRIRAKWLLTVWFVLQFFTAPNSGVAWAAHVGGFLFGAVVGIAVRASDGVQRALLRRDARPDGPWDPTGGAGYGYYNS
jgi:membrane associated rhomboid family serine protease